MHTIIIRKTVGLLGLALLLQVTNAPAQKKDSRADEPANDYGQDRKKMTIVIEGDKVTVNGKTITVPGVTVNGAIALAPLPPRAPHHPIPPRPPRFFMSDGERFHDLGEPRALLGVFSEKDDKGARITEVVEGSPAEKAGLQKGDIITKVEDKEVTDPSILATVIRSFKPEQEVTVSYLRGKKKHTAKVLLGKQQSALAKSFQFEVPDFGDDFRKKFDRDFRFEWRSKPKLGIRIQDLENGKGVKVLEVEDASAAAKAGIQNDDILISIDGQDIDNADQAREKIQTLGDKTSYPVKLKRGNDEMELQINIPKPLKTADL